MSKAAQLKRKAAELEQKRQYDRALALYVQAVEASAGNPEEVDIPVYNRIGDLHLRLGQLDRAVSYYETAVDMYSEGGFFNNAIALCNKVLRHAPARSVIYYKLGKISARKGFNSDAKQNFLEYASRMERSGDIAEAFRALKEFADLCPGQDDVRLMLAEQLARAGWTNEALDQLQTVYQTMLAEDRSAEAAATLQRIRALDPAFEPRASGSQRQEKRDGLVFIDVNEPVALFGEAVSRPDAAAAQERGTDVPAAREVAEFDSLGAGTRPEAHPLSASDFDAVQLPAPADEHVRRTLDDSPLAGLTPLEDPIATMALDPRVGSGQLSGIEPTSLNAEAGHFDPGSPAPRLAQPLGLEHTSFDTVSPPPANDIARSVGDSDAASERAWSPGPLAGTADIAPSDSAEVLEPDAVAEEGSVGEALSGYLASLAGDVRRLEGGLPDDLALLPPEALAEDQAPVPQRTPDDEYVDLNEWLREGEAPRNPRMTGAEEPEEEGGVQTDFSRMLDTFKRGVAQNVDETDLDSHYDLGVAYMEMGLLDEATAQFQKVLRGDASPASRVRAYESLGQSFIEKGDHAVALDSLHSALREPGLNDAKLVGVLYLMGYASERMNAWQEAEGFYRRVFAVDIHFRDVGERLRRAEQMR